MKSRYNTNKIKKGTPCTTMFLIIQILFKANLEMAMKSLREDVL